MKRPSNLWISISMVFLALGFLISVQFRATTTETNIPLRRTQDMAMELYNTTLERDRLAEEIVNLRNSVNSNNELEKAYLKVGITAVSGPGIILTLNNATQESNIYLINAEDILKLVNECWAAGAEAVSLNDNRIIAMSGFKAIDSTIMINQSKISAPYVIKAIGDPEVLERSLLIKGGWLETMKIWGTITDLNKDENINLPGYRGPIEFNYGKSAK